MTTESLPPHTSHFGPDTYKKLETASTKEFTLGPEEHSRTITFGENRLLPSEIVKNSTITFTHIKGAAEPQELNIRVGNKTPLYQDIVLIDNQITDDDAKESAVKALILKYIATLLDTQESAKPGLERVAAHFDKDRNCDAVYGNGEKLDTESIEGTEHGGYGKEGVQKRGAPTRSAVTHLSILAKEDKSLKTIARTVNKSFFKPAFFNDRIKDSFTKRVADRDGSGSSGSDLSSSVKLPGGHHVDPPPPPVVGGDKKDTPPPPVVGGNQTAQQVNSGTEQVVTDPRTSPSEVNTGGDTVNEQGLLGRTVGAVVGGVGTVFGGVATGVGTVIGGISNLATGAIGLVTGGSSETSKVNEEEIVEITVNSPSSSPTAGIRRRVPLPAKYGELDTRLQAIASALDPLEEEEEEEEASSVGIVEIEFLSPEEEAIVKAQTPLLTALKSEINSLEVEDGNHAQQNEKTKLKSEFDRLKLLHNQIINERTN